MLEKTSEQNDSNNLANNNLKLAENKKVFEAYLQAYENLTPENIETELAPLLSKDIEFKDPFNHVHTSIEALNIFKHMFSTTFEPNFKIKHAQVSHNVGFAYWQFTFKTKQQGKVNTISGTSLIEISQHATIQKHIDFWDPAEHIYKHLPIVGTLIRFINKRLSAQ